MTATVERTEGPDVAEPLVPRVLLVLVALVPVAYVGVTVGRLQLTGLAWLAGLALTLPLVLVRRLPTQAVRWLGPYWAFLAVSVLALSWAEVPSEAVSTVLQLAAPVPALLLAASAARPAALVVRLRRVAEVGIVLAVLVTAAESVGALPAALPLSPRPMAIALVGLYAIATLDVPRRRALLWSVVVVGVALWTGGRTATAVLLVVVLLSPSWRLTWRGRTALVALAMAALAAYSTTTAFQERFFFDGRGSLGDALGGSAQLNTAGRRELWPALAEQCRRATWTGGGPSYAALTSSELSLRQLDQPHNDYLRTWCDVGVVGAVPFWGFFLAGLARSAVLARRGSRAAGAAAQVLVALLLLSLTDNPVIYTAHFMVPLGVLLGLTLNREEAP